MCSTRRKVPQKPDSLKSLGLELGLEPRLSDFSQKWATISGCIFFQVPRFRVHASERENKTHTHTTRAKKGPVWLFLKRAPGGIKRGRGNPTNHPNPTRKLACSQCIPLPTQSGREKGVENVPPLVVTGVGIGKLPNHYCQSLQEPGELARAVLVCVHGVSCKGESLKTRTKAS